jgi:hypothetical protein
MKLFLSFLMLFIFTGCGTTYLVTNNANVDIYVNNQYKGKGEATLTRTGIPQKVHIDAKYNNKQVGSMDLHRKVKVITVIIGLYTYGIGFFLSWKYPETVVIPINDLQEKKTFDKKGSVWDLPPGEWKK